jgi:hypothetical protein
MSNKELYETFQEAIHNPVFGGSVLGSIKSIQENSKKPNNLKDQIIGIPIDLGSGGGFYELTNLKK